jgi:ubiquitin carboxyl-terminal hydrolase 6/32
VQILIKKDFLTFFIFLQPIPDDSLRMRDEQAKPINLAECMAEFTKEELLDGADTMYCSKCKEHRTTKKQLSVYSVPEVVIFLKRL